MFYGSRVQVSSSIFNRASATTLGVLSDLAIVALPVAWAILVYRTTKVMREGERGSGLLLALVPALLFVTLYASYAYIRSEPRWRAWRLPLDRLSVPVTQEIRLGEPIPRRDLASATWLIDLRSSRDPPPLRIAVNGEWLPLTSHTWRRPFCGELGAGLSTFEQRWCSIYTNMASFSGPLGTWQQWWSIPIDAGHIADRSLVTLTLTVDAGAENGDGRPVELGGTLADALDSSFYGPSVKALTPGSRTSLYRWHVADDWRIWETNVVESYYTVSRVEAGPPETLPGELVSIVDLIGRKQAFHNIRLLVVHSDGRQAVY